MVAAVRPQYKIAPKELHQPPDALALVRVLARMDKFALAEVVAQFNDFVRMGSPMPAKPAPVLWNASIWANIVIKAVAVRFSIQLYAIHFN